MSFFSPEQKALRTSARAFVAREVAPHLQAWEDAGEVPRALHLAAAQQGFLGLGVPEELGGSGGTFLDSLALTEAMAEAGASSGLLAGLFTAGIALPHIVAAGTPDLVDRFVRPTLAGETIGALAVTEPGGGSDVANIRTTAVRDGDSYVVNGAKTFITSGVRADFVTTAVRTGGPGYGGVSLLVVERGAPGFAVTRALAKMGWHCSDTAELSFTDVRVPAANLVGAEDGGFALIAQQFVAERLALAVHGYGIAARALALTVDHAKGRETFGRPLASRQVVQHRLVEMHRRVDVARLRTTAVREGDHYVVNGAKTFITSGVRADFVTTAVRTGGPGYAGVSLLVIEKGAPGFEVTRSLEKMGWHCSDTAELSFADVRVPASNLVGEENSGFALIAQQFVTERLALAVHGYGIAARALDLTVEYAKQRETFGKPLAARQVVQHKLVEMHRKVDVARTYTREIARRFVEGENPLAEALQAKAFAVEACSFVVDQAVQIHGGTGYMHGIEVERAYRDARILGIGGGATEVLNDLTARLLGYTP